MKQCNKNSIQNLNIIEKPLFEFLAISDIHLKHSYSVETTRLEKAIKLGYQHTNNLDLIIISGDYSDGGHDPQYAQFVKTINDLVDKKTKIIVNHGNHENGRFESDSHEFFRETFGYGVDYMWKIGDYYFITLGVHHGDKYIDNQAKWLKNKLAIASKSDDKKPIFVLTHYPVYGTVISNDHNSKRTFAEVLKDYPQVVNISGHTHQALNDPRVIHQKDFTSFNNGSLSYLIIHHYEFPSDYDLISKGHFSIFKVYKDHKVVIERHIIDDSCDEAKSTKIPDDFVIYPSLGKAAFSYTPRYFDDGSIPSFPKNTKLHLSKEENQWYINFTQAMDKNFVYYYNISFKDLTSNEVVYETKCHSQFYENTMPEILKSKVKYNLLEGNRYEVSLIAYNVANRASEEMIFTIQI